MVRGVPGARGDCGLHRGAAAYASYVHQWKFAVQGGVDSVSASLWPLSVDGLLLLATAGLLEHAEPRTRRARWPLWSAFLLGIAVSLAAQIAAAPALEWKPVLVAGWPPVALLLLVERLVHRPGDRVAEGTGWVTRRNGTEERESERGADDPLLQRAKMLDARHWEHHQRPVSAETYVGNCISVPGDPGSCCSRREGGRQRPRSLMDAVAVRWARAAHSRCAVCPRRSRYQRNPK
ncbi:DUF2637 domain-containing protein [Streptomyces sp. NPDC093591]|uniref:DUF2637 domain-containing protein n=1 Tax=Streptomyces sp. NPDC093591 TaxID=3366044 RepID=UPI0038147725